MPHYRHPCGTVCSSSAGHPIRSTRPLPILRKPDRMGAHRSGRGFRAPRPLGIVYGAAAGRFVPSVARWFCRPASMGGKWGPRPGPQRHPPNPRFSPAGAGLAPPMRGTASLVTRKACLAGQALASPLIPFRDASLRLRILFLLLPRTSIHGVSLRRPGLAPSHGPLARRGPDWRRMSRPPLPWSGRPGGYSSSTR